MKKLFNKMKDVFKEMKFINKIKNTFAKMMTKHNEDGTSENTIKNVAEEGSKKFWHENAGAQGFIIGNVLGRVQKVVNKLKKKISKKFNKKDKNNENPSAMSKIWKVTKRVVSIILALAFAVLVIYAIKDVFLSCLELVALCVAVIVSVEFILSILSCAIGYCI